MDSSSRDPAELARRKLSTQVMAGRAFLIKTPPAQRYFRETYTWLTTGALGALVYGRPRLGKTSATRWVLSALGQALGPLPWLEIPIRGQRVASEREFFQHILRCARHREYGKGTAGDRRDRLAEWLIRRARRSPVNAFVMFIDEAQLLTEHHYYWLLNIGNELDAAGCRLFCLLVGQSELMDDKQEMIDAGQEQIVGRFMVRTLEFPGIQSEDEVRQCLEAYDQTEYPPGSGKRFTEHYVPKAVSKGLHLQSLAAGVWGNFATVWRQVGFEGPAVIPMHYLGATITGVLNAVADHDADFLTVDQGTLARCVQASGYYESLRMMRATLAKGG